MTHLTKPPGFAALAFGLIAIGMSVVQSAPASAAEPDSQYNTREVVRAPLKVHTHTRYVDHTREIKRTKLIQENRTVLHIQPVINREVIVHRENTVIRNITLHRLHTINKTHRVYRNETVNRYVKGTTRVINERREVPDLNSGRSERVSYR